MLLIDYLISDYQNLTASKPIRPQYYNTHVIALIVPPGTAEGIVLVPAIGTDDSPVVR